MTNNIIRLCYRKIIGATAVQPWDKYVFESSYSEFLLQSQFYNQEKQYSSFSDLLQHVPKAEKLHFLVSAAVTGYVQQLNSRVPDILDNQGRLCLSFTDYRFEIIDSDTKNKANHQVAINFYSEALVWYRHIDHYLLVAPVNAVPAADGVLTCLLPLVPMLSIYSLKETTI